MQPGMPRTPARCVACTGRFSSTKSFDQLSGGRSTILSPSKGFRWRLSVTRSGASWPSRTASKALEPGYFKVVDAGRGTIGRIIKGKTKVEPASEVIAAARPAFDACS